MSKNPATAPAASGYVAQNSSSVVGLTYGPAGSGKSADMIFSFPRWIFIAAPGGIEKPAIGLTGFMPRIVEDKQLNFTLKHVCAVIEQARAAGYPGVCIDDFSLIAENTVSSMKGSGWAFWDSVREVFHDFREKARICGVHVWANAHEVSARTKEKDGQYIRGGPRLPMKDMTEDLPVLFDWVLRANVDPQKAMAASSMGHAPWPGAYRCSRAETAWITKDRHAVTPDYAPMNLAELMRAAGYQVDRAPGLEWQEQLIEGAAQAICAGSPEPEVLRFILQHGTQRTNEVKPLRWMLRDARDRAAIRRANSPSELLKEFGI
jgi:hypothetical protein